MSHADYCSQFISPGDKVLDIGSGRGKFLCEMARRGFKVFGVEVGPEYISETKNKAAAENLNISVEKAAAENLPFPDNYFDFVNCAEVSEHVNDPMKMCGEIFRVLKPSGKCYISFANRFGLHEYHYQLNFINWLPRLFTEPILKFLKKQKQDSIIGRQKLTTMHYYTYGRIANLLKRTGFVVADIRIERIKNKFGFSSPIFLAPYFLLRYFYFNTFHILLRKSNQAN